jgi:hypothetical protein
MYLNATQLAEDILHSDCKKNRMKGFCRTDLNRPVTKVVRTMRKLSYDGGASGGVWRSLESGGRFWCRCVRQECDFSRREEFTL